MQVGGGDTGLVSLSDERASYLPSYSPPILYDRHAWVWHHGDGAPSLDSASLLFQPRGIWLILAVLILPHPLVLGLEMQLQFVLAVRVAARRIVKGRVEVWVGKAAYRHLDITLVLTFAIFLRGLGGYLYSVIRESAREPPKWLARQPQGNLAKRSHG